MGAAAIPLVAAGTALNFMGTWGQADAVRSQGRRQAAALDYQAGELDALAGQEKAAGQASALEVERQGRIINSTVLARAAASGGGASDPTVLALMKRNAGETWYRSALARFEGDEQARVTSDKAAAARFGASMAEADSAAAARALRTKAFAGVLSAVGTSVGPKYFKPPTSGAGFDVGDSGSFDNPSDSFS